MTTAATPNADAEIIPPTTDDVGRYIKDCLGDTYIDMTGPQGVERDSIDIVDDTDASNLKLMMASGAVFIVRVIRAG